MRELFRGEGLPTLQNRVYPTAQEAKDCLRGDVVLVQDETTGLVFNGAFDPSRLVYDKNYQNEQACSPAFRKHLEQVAQIIERYGQGKKLLEVGCGKGWFLEMLRQRGHDITGFDPAYEGDALDIIKAAFSPELGMQGDVLILRHVLEHIPGPVPFLHEIARSNGNQGLIYIEVPCLDWIMQHRAWFDIFYEHVNYFRLDDFRRIFGRVVDAGRIFGGQYLYVVADLATIQQPRITPAELVDFPADFLASVNQSAAYCQSQEHAGRAPVVWGAASKGVIFSLYMQRQGVTPEAVIDVNPVKQGKYLPATGLLVESPASALQRLPDGAVILVMNSNYLDEIKAQTNHRFTYRAIDQAS